jgi:hypothetical protein
VFFNREVVLVSQLVQVLHLREDGIHTTFLGVAIFIRSACAFFILACLFVAVKFSLRLSLAFIPGDLR